MNYKNYNDYELIYSVREKDDFAFDIIFEKYQPIIHKIAGDYFKSYSNYGYDYQDFVQEGNIAFQKALIYYDENKNSIFSENMFAVRQKRIFIGGCAENHSVVYAKSSRTYPCNKRTHRMPGERCFFSIYVFI